MRPQRVRKLIAATGKIVTVAGSALGGYGGDTGQGPAAHLNFPTGVTIDAAGALYISDWVNHRIRKIAPPTAALQITTLAGNGTAGYDGDGGPAPGAKLYRPTGIAVDAAGNVYVADYYNHTVRKVAPTTGLITTVAGIVSPVPGRRRSATSTRLYPSGLAGYRRKPLHCRLD